jgi:hypothetical protein
VIPVGAYGPHGAGLLDSQRLVTSRYGGAAGVTYLIRPDQHVLRRWGRFDARRLRAAWDTYRRYDERSESP